MNSPWHSTYWVFLLTCIFSIQDNFQCCCFFCLLFLRLLYKICSFSPLIHYDYAFSQYNFKNFFSLLIVFFSQRTLFLFAVVLVFCLFFYSSPGDCFRVRLMPVSESGFRNQYRRNSSASTFMGTCTYSSSFLYLISNPIFYLN